LPQLEDKKEVEKVLMKKLATTIFQIVALLFLIGTYNNFSMNLPVAVKIEKENVVLNEIKQDLEQLNADRRKIPELANAVYIAHQSTGLNPKLITALMKTESDFKPTAIGPANRTNIRYKGLMQTPTATLQFSDVDVLHGARILKQKLDFSRNDLRMALALYKGGNNPVAYRQAAQVLKVYNTLL
jgi:soluble lytic murein transglycosylase-like protein